METRWERRGALMRVGDAAVQCVSFAVMMRTAREGSFWCREEKKPSTWVETLGLHCARSGEVRVFVA